MMETLSNHGERLNHFSCDIAHVCPNQPWRKLFYPSHRKNRVLPIKSFLARSSIETANNNDEFNRNTLFIWHACRMHVHKISSPETEVFDASFDDIWQKCWVQLCTPPLRSFCSFCRFKKEQYLGLTCPWQQWFGRSVFVWRSHDQTFEVEGSWDERIKRVGEHFQKGDRDEVEEDVFKQ